MMKVRYLISVPLILAGLGILSGMSSGTQVECTVIVLPGQSIQKAIDGAPEGAVICVAEGLWEENLRITKSLTLKGAGQEKTKIKGKAGGSGLYF